MAKTRRKPKMHSEAVAFLKNINAEFDLTSEADARRIQLASEAWHEYATARDDIRSKGDSYVDRFGQEKPRPQVAIRRDARIAFTRLIRELALDVDGPEETSHPRPISPGSHRKKG